MECHRSFGFSLPHTLLEIILPHIVTISTNPEGLPCKWNTQQGPGLPLVLEAANQLKMSYLKAGAAWSALPNSSQPRKAPQFSALPSLDTHPLRSGILLCKPRFREESPRSSSVLGSTRRESHSYTVLQLHWVYMDYFKETLNTVHMSLKHGLEGTSMKRAETLIPILCMV